jgi:hypothetical protein
MNHKHSRRRRIIRSRNKTFPARQGSENHANKKVTNLKRRGMNAVRGGQASIELVAMTAVMVPFVGFVLFTGLKVCKQVYMTANNALCWPFM